MYGLDQLTNAPQPVTLAGRTFAVRQLRLREWGELQAWLKSVAPSPVAVAIRGLAELRDSGFATPKDLESALFAQAQDEARRWPPKVATGAWFRALDETEGGHARVVLVALRASGHAISEAEAADVAEASSGAELTDLMRVCVHGDHVVPKGQGATTPPSPTTGGSGSSESGPTPAGPTTQFAA